MTRPFHVFIDDGVNSEPDRTFATLHAALAAVETMSPEEQRYAWIIERPERGKPITHMIDGTEQF